MPSKIKTIIFYGTMLSAIRMLTGAISVVYLLHNGLSIRDVGFLKSFQAAIILFLDVPVSYFSDRYSRKFSVIMATILAVLWLVQMGIATTVWQFYLAEFFNSLSLCLFNGAFIAFLIDTKNSVAPTIANKTLIGNYQKHQTLNMAVSAFLGAAFIDTSSRAIWLIAAGAMALLLALGAWRLPADYQTVATPSEKKSHFTVIKDDFAAIVSALRDHSFLLMAMVAFIAISFYFQVILQFWQPILAILHSNVGLFYGSVFAGILLTQSFASWLSEKNRHAWRFGVVALLLAPVFLLLSVNIARAQEITILSSIILLFFGGKICQIHSMAVFHDLIGAHNRATFDSLVSLCNRLMMIVFFPLITFSSAKLAIVFATVLLAIALFYAVVNRRLARSAE